MESREKSGDPFAQTLVCPLCRRDAAADDCSALCSRCGADLSLYLGAATLARNLLQQAAAHLRTSPQTALQLAKRSKMLHATAASCRIQAVAALCARDYSAALFYYAKAPK